MAAFNFPNSPSDGDTHTENGLTYVWDGTNGAWKRSPASLSKGVKGDKGDAGTDGDKGSKGDNKGEQGDKGEPGDVLAKGNKGDEGDKGQKGEVGADNSTKGQKGEPGTGDKGESGSAVINNNADNRIITGSNTAGELNAEANFTFDGIDVTANHSNGQVLLSPADGAIEITRNSSGAYIDFKNTINEDYDARISENGGGFIMTGVIQNASVASAWVQFNGTGTVSIQSDVNVSTITDYGVGDYQVNYSNQLKDGNNSTTDYQAISLAITGTVYNVPGQLAHTHPFVYTADRNHVRFLCYKTENSNQRADQVYAGVIVFS